MSASETEFGIDDIEGCEKMLAALNSKLRPQRVENSRTAVSIGTVEFCYIVKWPNKNYSVDSYYRVKPYA